MSPRQATIYCTKSLRDSWPDPLAAEWQAAYPVLFDADDLRLTVTQPWTHFWEWYAAIHVFQRDHAYSLVEKYGCKSHPDKLETYNTLLGEGGRAVLDDICSNLHVQSPDLLAYQPDLSRYWFVEVKGPGDRLSTGQIASHNAIESRLGVPVEVIRVVIDEDV